MSANRVFVGFDGSIDRTVRPIRTVGEPNRFFATIEDFGRYLAGKAGLSCAVQTQAVECRAGGNGPYFAQALAGLGFEIHLAGMLGQPKIDPLFAPLAQQGIDLYSYAQPEQTECYEFEDGKIMISPQVPPLKNPFQQVQAAMGSKLELLRTSHLTALLNWGEIGWMQTLWSQAVEYLAAGNTDGILFIDPADLSCRSKEEILQLLKLLRQARKLRYTVLSVNENEALRLGQITFQAQHNLEDIPRDLVTSGFAHEAVVHTTRTAIAFDGTELAAVPACHVEQPVISTGAGDHFNAGYCAALLSGAQLKQRLCQGNQTAWYHLTTGQPCAYPKL